MISLVVQKREETGKKLKKLREEKMIPGIIYGKEAKNLPVKVDYKKFKETYKIVGESSILNLKIEGENKEYPVLIREVQKDPLTENIIHVDFYQLPMNKEVGVTVPFEFEGVAPAEKERGAILVKNLHEIEIKALPKNLIHSIKIDLSSLKNIDDEIRIKDLKLPEGVKIEADPEEIIVVAIAPKEEKIEEEVVQKPEEVEVIKEKEEAPESEGESEEKEKK